MIRIIVVSVLVIACEGVQQPRLVYPHLLDERSADGRMVMHLHDKLTLNLRKASVTARNFRVLEHEDGREVTHFFNGEDLEQDLHEDEKQFASVHVRRRDGGVEVEGVVGPRHRIEPMPTMERSDEGLIPHMIHEIESKQMHDIEMTPRGKGASTVRLEKDEFSPYRNGTDKYLESSSSLDNFRLYAHGKRYEFGSPDMTYLFTGYDVFTAENDGTKSTSVLGIGFVGGLCTDFFVALGEDTAGLYTGMHTLTHEAGHVLGAAHDESRPKPWIKNDPGSLECLWKEGYIMSYVDGGEKHHHFSPCSLRQIRNVIMLRGRDCWRLSNAGHTKEGIYPGMEVAPNAYCRHAFPDKENVTADMDSPTMKECMVKCQYPEYRRICHNGRCFTYVTTLHPTATRA
ncbi:hypothetical protein MTO96_014757 [Rhipicephalus appendiculatus]